jgi:hypothetical protein
LFHFSFLKIGATVSKIGSTGIKTGSTGFYTVPLCHSLTCQAACQKSRVQIFGKTGSTEFQIWFNRISNPVQPNFESGSTEFETG